MTYCYLVSCFGCCGFTQILQALLSSLQYVISQLKIKYNNDKSQSINAVALCILTNMHVILLCDASRG